MANNSSVNWGACVQGITDKVDRFMCGDGKAPAPMVHTDMNDKV